MRTSSITHWLYCSIKNRYGEDIEIRRDSLRNVYTINKYGIDLSPENIIVDACILTKPVYETRSEFVGTGSPSLDINVVYTKVKLKDSKVVWLGCINPPSDLVDMVQEITDIMYPRLKTMKELSVVEVSGKFWG